MKMRYGIIGGSGKPRKKKKKQVVRQQPVIKPEIIEEIPVITESSIEIAVETDHFAKIVESTIEAGEFKKARKKLLIVLNKNKESVESNLEANKELLDLWDSIPKFDKPVEPLKKKRKYKKRKKK